MSERYTGSILVTACDGSRNFRLSSVDNNKNLPLPMHADSLQPFVSRTINHV